MQQASLRLPENNNFYAVFTGVNKTQIKELFEGSGWNSRKPAWFDFELSNAWSELILEGEENEPIMNGSVIYDEQYVALLRGTFTLLPSGFSFEFYDDDKNLLVKEGRG